MDVKIREINNHTLAVKVNNNPVITLIDKDKKQDAVRYKKYRNFSILQPIYAILLIFSFIYSIGIISHSEFCEDANIPDWTLNIYIVHILCNIVTYMLSLLLHMLGNKH